MASIAPPMPGPCSETGISSRQLRTFAMIRLHRRLLAPPPQIRLDRALEFLIGDRLA